VPRLLPPSPEWADGRHGERAVWEALRDALPDEVALLHSVWLVERDHEYEADLVVAWPGVGICVVEVKGGQVSRDGSGRWFQTKAGQPPRPMGNPMTQASHCRHVLQRYLAGRHADAARSRTAHVVAMPHMALPQSFDAADMPRTLVIDKSDLADVAGRVREAIERHGDGHQPLDASGLEQLLALLVAQLPGQASLLSVVEEHEQRVDQLTRDQVAVLDSFRYHLRLSVIGGAGTGKTWLALEQARRLTRDGRRVALVCYSRGLGRFLQRVSDTWPKKPAYVGLFHDLPLQWGAEQGAEDDSDYYERRLPLALGELAAARSREQLFDGVVVDKAQDFGELWWPALVACLRDPEAGGLFVFLDEAQRVFARTSEAPVGNEPYLLTTNIRNTKKIAQVFGSLTGEQAKYRGLDGPPVRFVQAQPQDAVDRADAAVEALLDEDWDGGQIALLTTHHRHPVHVQAVEHRGQQGYWDDFFAGDDVFYGHVLGIKGLERQVVVLAVDGFRDLPRAREMLYVGLSRARTQLVVVGDLEQLRMVGGDGVANDFPRPSSGSFDPRKCHTSLRLCTPRRGVGLELHTDGALPPAADAAGGHGPGRGPAGRRRGLPVPARNGRVLPVRRARRTHGEDLVQCRLRAQRNSSRASCDQRDERTAYALPHVPVRHDAADRGLPAHRAAGTGVPDGGMPRARGDRRQRRPAHGRGARRQHRVRGQAGGRR